VALAAVAEPAAAQATIGWDASLFSSYVWRGVTYTNKPVLQPDLYVTIPLGKASFTAGGWANIDIGKYDGSTDLSGRAAVGLLAEFDWWGEIGIPAGKATLTAGATGYIFPNDAGFTSDANTIEIYGKVALDVPLSPVGIRRRPDQGLASRAASHGFRWSEGTDLGIGGWMA
jgi:hypothetical protein